MENKNLTLFMTFASIGAFTFGGGYAMIPLIQKEVVENRKWIDEKDMLDMVAISQSTPGPLAINCATFVGYKVNGVLGSAFATLGVVIPSFLIIIIVSLLYNMFSGNEVVQHIFLGIRAGVILLIGEAALKLSKPLKMNAFNLAIIIGSLILTVFTNMNVIYILIACGILGILAHSINKSKGGKINV